MCVFCTFHSVEELMHFSFFLVLAYFPDIPTTTLRKFPNLEGKGENAPSLIHILWGIIIQSCSCIIRYEKVQDGSVLMFSLVSWYIPKNVI